MPKMFDYQNKGKMCLNEPAITLRALVILPDTPQSYFLSCVNTKG